MTERLKRTEEKLYGEWEEFARYDAWTMRNVLNRRERYIFISYVEIRKFFFGIDSVNDFYSFRYVIEEECY